MLSKTANDQLQSQREYKKQQYDNIGQNKQETTKETNKKEKLISLGF
jgi:hypothetical protein